jgi:hypothetical protein
MFHAFIIAGSATSNLIHQSFQLFKTSNGPGQDFPVSRREGVQLLKTMTSFHNPLS